MCDHVCQQTSRRHLRAQRGTRPMCCSSSSLVHQAAGGHVGWRAAIISQGSRAFQFPLLLARAPRILERARAPPIPDDHGRKNDHEGRRRFCQSARQRCCRGRWRCRRRFLSRGADCVATAAASLVALPLQRCTDDGPLLRGARASAIEHHGEARCFEHRLCSAVAATRPSK